MTLELAPWKGDRVPVLSSNGKALERSYSLADVLQWQQQAWSFGGNLYPTGATGVTYTQNGKTAEPVANNFEGYVRQLFYADGPVAAVEWKRVEVFAQAPMLFQKRRDGRPGDLYDDDSLDLVRAPWVGGTTSDLQARSLLFADLGGNAYVVIIDDELVVLRPDYVEIVLEPRMVGRAQVGWRQVAISYTELGPGGGTPAVFMRGEYAHYAPKPDPLASYRGMSWLTPVIREVQADVSAVDGRLAFQNNASAQPMDARIATPGGWTTMGSVQAGSKVMGPDGHSRTVLGIYPQGVKDVYRLTFTGGATTECCEDHVWTVANSYDRRLGRTRNVTLRQIIDGGLFFGSKQREAKWYIPIADPVEYEPAPERLLVDPYLLGALMGNGSFRSNGQGSGGISFSSFADDADEYEAYFETVLPAGVSISRRNRGGWCEFYFRGLGGPRTNPLTAAIKQLGLFDVIGHQKEIPAAYMTAPIKDRMRLLQGLIDTDGNTSSSAGADFVSTSRRLAEQVKELADGLGGTAKLKEQPKGDRRQQWQVYISNLPAWVCPVRLSRKLATWDPPVQARWRALRSVEFARRAEVQCIKVDAEDGLYLTDDFIVTHNTPNLAVKIPQPMTADQFKEFVEMMDSQHRGAVNSGKTLYTAGGADVTVVGSSMREMDFTALLGKSETRVANAGGLHPAIVGFSEGMQGSSMNAGNYQAAKRQTVDTTFRHLWSNWCGSLQQLFPPPKAGDRLWYDIRDIPFLHDDAKDLAAVQQTQGAVITTYTREGFEPESAIAAVRNDDISLLKHTGLTSVQLTPPQDGSTTDPNAPPPDGPMPDAAAAPDQPVEDTYSGDQARAIAPDGGEIERGHPHPGQQYKHGWIPIAGDPPAVAGVVLTGQAALDAAPATYRSGPDAHHGNYEGATFDAPPGAGSEKALAEYEGLEYQHTNQYLRTGPSAGIMAAMAAMGETVSDESMRYAREDDAATAARIAEIDKTMTASRLTADVEVHRVVKDGRATFGQAAWFGDVMPDRRGADWKSASKDPAHRDKVFAQEDADYERWTAGERPDLTGLRFRDDGYTSTTANRDYAEAFGASWARTAREHTDFEGEPVLMHIHVPKGTGAIQLGDMGTTKLSATRTVINSAELMLEHGLTYEIVADHGVNSDGFRELDLVVVA